MFYYVFWSDSLVHSRFDESIFLFLGFFALICTWVAGFSSIESSLHHLKGRACTSAFIEKPEMTCGWPKSPVSAWKHTKEERQKWSFLSHYYERLLWIFCPVTPPKKLHIPALIECIQPLPRLCLVLCGLNQKYSTCFVKCEATRGQLCKINTVV